MSNATVFVDVEQPIRDWLRGQAVDGISTRVYVGLPTGATYPAISMALLDGGIDPGEAPIANALITFSVWAETRAAAQTAIWSLASKIHSLRYAVMGACVAQGAQVVLGPVYRPDPDGFPRFVLDAAFSMRVAT